MMERIEPASARYSLQDSFNGFRASVPARKNWFVMLFMCAWLGGWVMGETSAIGALFHVKLGLFGGSFRSATQPSAQLFLGFWLVAWTLGGAFALANVAWQLFGRESIGVEGGDVIHRVEALGIGRTRAFRSDQITHLRAVDMAAPSGSRTANWGRMPSLFGQGVGAIAFDYGARTYRAGASLDEAEARLLIEQMKRWLPEGAVSS